MDPTSSTQVPALLLSQGTAMPSCRQESEPQIVLTPLQTSWSCVSLKPSPSCWMHRTPCGLHTHPIIPGILKVYGQLWVSDRFDCSAKCLKKLVQRRRKEGRNKLIHGAGEQLPSAIGFTGRCMGGLEKWKIHISEKIP